MPFTGVPVLTRARVVVVGKPGDRYFGHGEVGVGHGWLTPLSAFAALRAVEHVLGVSRVQEDDDTDAVAMDAVVHTVGFLRFVADAPYRRWKGLRRALISAVCR